MVPVWKSQQTQLLFRASTRIFSELGKWLGSPESQFKSPTFPRLLLPPTAPYYSSTQLAWPFVVIWTSLVAQMVKCGSAGDVTGAWLASAPTREVHITMKGHAN